jgi:ABC-2 type transport system permease protein
MGRYLHVLSAMLALAFKRAVQYRSEFFVEGASTLLMIAVQLVPVFVLFRQREQVAGWTYNEMLVLLGWYLMVRSVLDGVIAPSLAQTIGGIRTGHFDYVLMKPADAMFLCSISSVRPWQVVHLLAGLAMALKGCLGAGQLPSPAGLAIAALVSVMGLLTLYSLFILCVAGSFVVVRIQNLMSVLGSLLAFSRWPVQVFEGLWQVFFTFVLPLAVITTFPSMALLNRLSPQDALTSLVIGCAFFGVARWVWLRALRRYRSASS